MEEEITEQPGSAGSDPANSTGVVEEQPQVPGAEVNPDGPEDGVELSHVDWNAPDPDDEQVSPTPSPEEGKQAETEEAETSAETEKKPEEEPKASSMRKQIVKGMEEKSEKEKADLRVEFEGRIKTLTDDLSRYQSQSKLPALDGNEDKRIEELKAKSAELEQQLIDEENTLSAVGVRNIDKKQDEIKEEIDSINNAKKSSETANEEFNNLRAKADVVAGEQFPFMNDKKSEEFKFAMTEVLPILKAINPNFEKDIPHDGLLLGLFTETAMKAQKYDVLMSKQPKPNATSKKPGAYITETVTPPKASTPSKMSDLNSLIKKAEKGAFGEDDKWGHAVSALIDSKGGG